MVRARGTSLQLLRGRARVAATSSPGKKGETLCRLPSGAQTPQGLGPQLSFAVLSFLRAHCRKWLQSDGC